MALRNWNPFARREPDSAAEPSPFAPALDAALGDLRRLAVDRPELDNAAAQLADVLRAAFSGPVAEPLLHAEPDLLDAAWRRGVPAFLAGDEPPTLDPEDLRGRALSVAEALPSPDARTLADALRANRLDLRSLALDALADRSQPLDARAADLAIPTTLLRSVLRLALLPPLARLAAALAALRPEGAWTLGGCPCCGSPPTLAESRGLEQRRVWRCGLCASAWEGERLRCPSCGENDHRRLHYHFVDGQQDRHRLARCDSCGSRLKVVSTLTPISAPGLLVAELATVHLDVEDADLDDPPA